jgi:hypothetical protein
MNRIPWQGATGPSLRMLRRGETMLGSLPCLLSVVTAGPDSLRAESATSTWPTIAPKGGHRGSVTGRPLDRRTKPSEACRTSRRLHGPLHAAEGDASAECSHLVVGSDSCRVRSVVCHTEGDGRLRGPSRQSTALAGTLDAASRVVCTPQGTRSSRSTCEV